MLADLSFMLVWQAKGPVKLIKRVKIAHSFLQSFKSVPLYYFKLAYVILQMSFSHSVIIHVPDHQQDARILITCMQFDTS